MLLRPPGFGKQRQLNLAHLLGLLLAGQETLTVPSVPMVMLVALLGMAMAGCSG